MIPKPTREELLNRIWTHQRHRNNNDECNLLWAGYLAACLEWRLISPADYDVLKEVVRPIGLDELREIFLGFPD